MTTLTWKCSYVASLSYLLWPWASHNPKSPSSLLIITFYFEILCIHCVLNWGLFPEGIYNPADDLRPTIISQLENQTSDERPFREEENPRWPLKNASDLRRWGAGRHALLISHWDFQLRLTSQALPGFCLFCFGQVATFERWQFKQWFVETQIRGCLLPYGPLAFREDDVHRIQRF